MNSRPVDGDRPERRHAARTEAAGSDTTGSASIREQGDAPADDSGVTSAEADVEAGFDGDDTDEIALGGTAEPDAPAESHQADVEAGYDDSNAADDR